MTEVELTIKGEVEVLRLQPGDVIVVTIHERMSRQQSDRVSEQVKARFPGHEVVLAQGLSLSVKREVAGD